MRDEGVIYVTGHPLLNRRCTRLPGCIRLRNDLYCVGWGVKLYTYSFNLKMLYLIQKNLTIFLIIVMLFIGWSQIFISSPLKFLWSIALRSPRIEWTLPDGPEKCWGGGSCLHGRSKMDAYDSRISKQCCGRQTSCQSWNVIMLRNTCSWTEKQTNPTAWQFCEDRGGCILGRIYYRANPICHDSGRISPTIARPIVTSWRAWQRCDGGPAPAHIAHNDSRSTVIRVGRLH